jgi:hypothetical protein
LDDRWREKLAEARSQFELNRNERTKAEYLRVLGIFTDLVLRDILPDESADG